MSDILNSVLSGDESFASNLFDSKPDEASETPETPETPDTPDTPDTPVEQEPIKKEEAPEETKDTPNKDESKKDVDSAIKEATESSSYESDEVVNPHFSDKPVADSPEGDLSEKGVSSWKEIKTEMKKAREERDRLKAQLDATKAGIEQSENNASDDLKSELEDYKVRVAELSQELKAANFERSPEYIDKIKKPLVTIQDGLRDIAEVNDADFSKLWQALSEPDIRKRTDSLEDLTVDFKRMEQLSIVKMADKYHELAEFHQKFQKESSSINEADSARRAAQEQDFIQNDQRLQKAFTAKSWTGLEDRHSFMREVDGNSEWNSHLRVAKKNASETNLDNLSVEDRSNILSSASAVPFLESAITHYSSQLDKVKSEKDAKISELETQLKALVGASPSIGSSSSESPVDDGGDSDDDLRNLGSRMLGL